MFSRIKAKLAAMGAIRTLCEGAERHARQGGASEPGAEHFLLAALDLPDGTARLAFARVGGDPADLPNAIARQYEDALREIGLEAGKLGAALEGPALPGQARGLYRAAGSGQAVMQALAARRGTPLRGAQVVAVVAGMPHGVAARALRAMGIAPEHLAAAAEALAAEPAAAAAR